MKFHCLTNWHDSHLRNGSCRLHTHRSGCFSKWPQRSLVKAARVCISAWSCIHQESVFVPISLHYPRRIRRDFQRCWFWRLLVLGESEGRCSVRAWNWVGGFWTGLQSWDLQKEAGDWEGRCWFMLFRGFWIFGGLGGFAISWAIWGVGWAGAFLCWVGLQRTGQKKFLIEFAVMVMLSMVFLSYRVRVTEVVYSLIGSLWENAFNFQTLASRVTSDRKLSFQFGPLRLILLSSCSPDSKIIFILS